MIHSKKLWFVAQLILPAVLTSGLCAGNVVSDWNAVASATVVATAGKTPGASTIWFAYTSLAMYDAVNAITGEYQPFYYHFSGPPTASIDAAAVAAAHRILVNYFPNQQTSLDSQYTTSIANITADPNAITDGVAVGEAAAMALISARTGDGLEANVTYTPGSGPGTWIPTPPAYAAPATPWLGKMRPFTMKAADDHLPGPPVALTSEDWKRDYNMTGMYGGLNSTVRSAAETEIGIYWTENTGQQYARAFNYLVTNNNRGTADASRFMAMVWTGMADAAIGCFNGKYTYGFWRPVTAIPAGGGSSDLTADPNWSALGTTPTIRNIPRRMAA